MKTIKVGSRESALAIAQARLVISAIGLRHPEVRTELVTMKTTGDVILDRSLDAIGGKGLFIRELDDALVSGRVDICVHSYKDVPVPDNPALPVVAVTRREDPRDVLILPEGADEMPPGKPIGTSSLRRRRQLAALFPDRQCEPVRGNVQTRLRKLDAGEYGGLVLAAAGIKRLGLWHRVHRVFEVDEIIPAACQGMLAIQGRNGEDFPFLHAVSDEDARYAAIAERAFIEGLEATCASPVAAYAVISDNGLDLRGFDVNDAGVVRKGRLAGSRNEAAAIGRELAEKLKTGDSGNV